MIKDLRQIATAVALSIGLALAGPALAADPGESWQERRLFEPSESQREQERRGTVFIYDGLESARVAQAMDSHFDRIENMMFTRTRHPPATPSGPAMVENDGCD